MKKLFLIILILFCALNMRAQSNFLREADSIQRRQQQDVQDMLRERDMAMKEKASTPQIVLEDGQAQGAAAPGACMNVSRIHISGVTKFKLKYLTQKVRAALPSCVDKTALQAIQSTVQKIYVDKGYIGARVYFDFSEISAKKLNIIILEGMLEDIVLLNPKTKEPQKNLASRLKILTAFPFTHGRILRLQDIEQGLEQMNRLSSNNAVMDVRPGSSEGGTVIVIDNEALPKNTLSVSYDNSGTQNTGTYRGTASFSRDNLFALNENIFINAATTLWNDTSQKYSRSLTGAISLPFGYWTVNESYSYSEYLTTSEGTVSAFKSSGSTGTNTLSLERMLLRGAAYKVSLGAQLTNKNSKNYIEDVYLETSSRKLSIGTLYITGTYYSSLGSFYSKLSANQGLKIMGALQDTDDSKGVPKAQYSSLGLYANYSKNFSWVNYTASFDGQYGADDMFGSEQFMIGGEASVRGFKEDSLMGESGLTFRQDLRVGISTFLGESKNIYLNKMLSNLYAGVFADYGFVSPKTYGQDASLAGAGAKISYYGKYLSGAFTYSHSIYTPDYMKSEGNVFYFNIALNVPF